MSIKGPAIPRQLSPEDKHFIKMVSDGSMKAPAFRESYPNHPLVLAYLNSEPGSPDRKKYGEAVIQAGRVKLNTQYIKRALTTYQDSMEVFSELSLKTATDLVQNARSEKVRSDLAIEGIRQKVGTPVQKVAVQEQKTVILTFGKPSDIIDL